MFIEYAVSTTPKAALVCHLTWLYLFVCLFVFVIFVINFISQLIRRLLGILRDWDFTRQQGDIQFFRSILEFMKVQEFNAEGPS